MKRKRSIAAILMACFLVLAAVGCSSGQTPSDTPSPAAETSTGQESTGQTEATQAPEAASAAENNTTDAAGGNVLVAYYSYTGTTEGVAQQIADLTGELWRRFSGWKITVICRKKRRQRSMMASARRLPSAWTMWKITIPFSWDILKWSRVISVYSGVLRGGRRANRYRKHNRKKKCV